MKNKILFILGILIVLLLPFGFSQLSTSFTNPAQYSYQFNEPGYNSIYTGGGSVDWGSVWPIMKNMEQGKCQATQDFLVMIPPLGCTPAVVRSDLLEEQNVPVFCPLSAVKINPMVDISSIGSISFKGKYPDGIAGISFHPNRAAIRSYNTLLGNPLLNNIGYVVIILKQNKKEDSMPDEIKGNLTATIRYDSEKAFGVGKSEIYAPLIDDMQWESDYLSYAFWKGRAFVRVTNIQESGGSGRSYSSTQGIQTGDIRQSNQYYSASGNYAIGNGKATVQIYSDKENVFQTITLDEGQTSNMFYLPGSYCRAGFQVRLNSLVAADKKARINIDGDDIWVTEGARILNDRCTVQKINIDVNETGSIRVYCNGKITTLFINDKGAIISIFNEQKEYKLGDKVGDFYLGYIGTGNSQAIVLINSSKALSAEEFAKISDVMSKGLQEVQIKWDTMQTGVKNSIGKEVLILPKGNAEILSGITFMGIANELEEKTASGTSINTQEGKIIIPEASSLSDIYFGSAADETDKLVQLYPNEKKDITNFAETALFEQAKLAGELGKIDSEREYLEKFKKYPESNYFTESVWKLNSIKNLDYSKSSAVIYTNNENHYISLESLKGISKQEKQAKISIGTISGDFAEGVKLGFRSFDKVNESRNESYVILKKIDANSVTIQYYYYDEQNKRFASPTQYLIGNGERKTFEKEGDDFVVEGINVERNAYLSIIPRIDNQYTEADFTFTVGIEKRAIKLNPSQTKDMIANLNKTIEQWDDANKKFADVLKGWKGACFATSGILALKNLAEGFSGESIARQKVMKNYREKCTQLISRKEYTTKTQCYNALATDIDSDVSAMTTAIQNTDTKISDIEKNHASSTGVLGIEKVVDSEASLADYKKKYGSEKITITGSDGTKQEISVSDLNSFEEIRAFELILQTSGSTQQSARYDGESLLKLALARKQETNSIAGAEIVVANTYKDAVPDVMYVSEGARSAAWSGQKADATIEKIANSTDTPVQAGVTPIQFMTINGNNYALVLAGRGKTSNTLGVEKVLKLENGVYSVASDKNLDKNVQNDLGKLNSYLFAKSNECKNPYQNLRARFYETGTDKYLPEIVPFDSANGWYVKVPSSLGSVLGSGMKGYTEAGDTSFFYICNVGLNGREENMGGDDICQSFDVNNYLSVREFGGCYLTPGQIGDLVRNARQAVRDAANQYSQGKRSIINIRGVSGDIAIEPPAVGNNEAFECQDFMSPDDCKLMFNVCDPVICPPSRCNLGGKYPVANVVQTGIIGSIALCLPNYKEGIYVPVCLTGIQAGIDSFISILKSERDCLQKSLDSGEHVGICDEITSIYLCEFFWREAAPLMKNIIPNLVSLIYGEGARGGGEYANVIAAWDNMQSGIDYFKSNYAQNSLKAFQARSVEDVGGTVCKAFVGTSFPSSGKMLDSLLAPESPDQFYATFDEIPFSEATVPATSQYKVYYHIFAGKDIGAQYAVYLRSPPATGYYTSAQQVYVKNGYIPRGESADETIDFTAPAGYKELCVVINAQEHCGFGQTTSSLGLQLVREAYMAQEGTATGINSERSCISGTPSVLAMVNPNLQAGAEEVINPEIDKQGIVRVCSTTNPGINIKTYNGSEGTDGIYRWKEVGTCGKAGNVTIKCWVDLASVDAQTKLYSAVAGTTQELIDKVADYDKEGIFTEQETSDALAEIHTRITKLGKNEFLVQNLVNKKGYLADYINPIVKNITDELDVLIGKDNVEGKAYLESQKAEALYLKSSLYRIVAKSLWAFPVENSKTNEAVSASVSSATSSTIVKIEGFEISNEDGKDYIYYNGENTYFYLSENRRQLLYNYGTKKIHVADIVNGVIRRTTQVDSYAEAKKRMDSINGKQINLP